MQRFVLEIDLGNDAMQDGRDIAGALMEVAGRIEDHGPFDTPRSPVVGTILDGNGSFVGRWSVRAARRKLDA